MTCETGSPFAEGGFSNVQPLSAIAHRPDDEVDMRVRFIGMQSHHIAMLESKLLPGEIPYSLMDLVGRRSGGHGECNFMDESWRLLCPSEGQVGLSALLDQFKIPVFQNVVPDVFASSGSRHHRFQGPRLPRDRYAKVPLDGS